MNFVFPHDFQTTSTLSYRLDYIHQSPNQLSFFSRNIFKKANTIFFKLALESW